MNRREFIKGSAAVAVAGSVEGDCIGGIPVVRVPLAVMIDLVRKNLAASSAIAPYLTLAGD